VVLTISDHLDWAEEEVHLAFLQDKLNTYLEFATSGQLEKAYPDSRGRGRRIDVVLRVPPSNGATEFFRLAKEQLEEAKIELTTRVHTAKV
jgi:hypothetical protein